MVARSDSMFGSNCYDSYSYRLWSLANVWNTCQLPPHALVNGGGSAAEDLDYLIKCSICQKGCQTFLALKEHMESVHPETSTENGVSAPAVSTSSYHCAQCTTSFNSKDQLDKHELLHSPNAQVSCKICNKTFANVYRLQRHMISHDESAVLRKFKCTECDKAFKFKHHLKEHIRIHSGEKPFECGNCGKRFSHSGSYSSHMTSKKCLVMNLKLGRTRSAAPPATLEKTPVSIRTAPRSPEPNSYLPILPKYSEAAAAFLQSSIAAANSQLPPFYLTPPLLNAPQYNLPTLSQILDQMQRNRQQQTSFEAEIDVESERAKSDCSGELIMDEERASYDDEEHGDLEAVKRILETVNASVTKEFLTANMQKFTSDSSNAPSECHTPPKEPASCNVCKKTYESLEQLNEHSCSYEGLAVKLEESVNNNNNNNNVKEENNSDQEYDVKKEEEYCESVTTTDHVSEDGRKVRVRSLISESQLKVLKDNYMVNPRPKREDLEKIATSIGFPVRVVQVWFQNTRARDRREGRLVQVPYSPHKFQPVKIDENYDEPLDLSTKKSNASTPSSSPPPPPRPTSPNNNNNEFCDDEVVNLSVKTPPPNNNSTSRLAQILVQPHHHHQTAKLNLGGMGLVPMEQLMQFGVANLSQLISTPSPNSEKRCYENAPDEDDATAQLTKRLKMSQYMLKSLGSPLLGNQESEAEGQFICDQCDKAFSKQSSLARHKYEHSGQRPHKCDECPKAFKHKHHLTEHKRLHSGEKPFQCLKCLKRFSHSGSYSQHMNHRYSYCKPYRE